MTQQQMPERRPSKIDLNLLPPEYRPKKKSYLNLILYVTVFILACVVAFLIIVKVGVSSDINALKQDLVNLQQQLNTLQANKTEADAIKAQITQAQDELASTETDYEDYINGRFTWSEIVSEIDDLVPGKKVTLMSISIGAGNVITLSGTSTKRMNVYDYAVKLEDSDLFETVDFSFGDCPETSNCQFSITMDLTEPNPTEGGVNE